MEIVEVKLPLSGKVQLAGKVLRNEKFSPSGRQPVILVIHGWSSTMERYPERLAPLIEMGYVGLLFDLRGHGRTPGDLKKLTIKDHLDDCIAAFDFIKTLSGVDVNDVSVYGSSYGGYLACLLTAKRRVNNLILKAPALYDDAVFESPNDYYAPASLEYRSRHHQSSDNYALDAISKFKGNILFIECEKDDEVPKQVTEDYRQAITVNYDYALLAGADHALKLPAANKAFIAVLAKWFVNLASKNAASKKKSL